MSDKFGYVVLEVGGIQKYILSTGKLKEMIGGSELIESLSAKYLDEVNSHSSKAPQLVCSYFQFALKLL